MVAGFLGWWLVNPILSAAPKLRLFPSFKYQWPWAQATVIQAIGVPGAAVLAAYAGRKTALFRRFTKPNLILRQEENSCLPWRILIRQLQDNV